MADVRSGAGDLISRRTATRIAIAGFVGTVIEYFEFMSYGYLAVVIAPRRRTWFRSAECG